jgi:hypothetical protein
MSSVEASNPARRAAAASPAGSKSPKSHQIYKSKKRSKWKEPVIQAVMRGPHLDDAAGKVAVGHGGERQGYSS